jgi:hypothetical protein
MEPIIDYLKRNLRDAGSARWEAIAADCGIAKTLPRKIAFNDRDNPGVQTIQPLVDYFQAVDRGEKHLPALANTTQPATETIAVAPTPIKAPAIDPEPTGVSRRLNGRRERGVAQTIPIGAIDV